MGHEQRTSAVGIWKGLGNLFPGYQLGEQWFAFDHEVRDHYGFTESGQDMLGVRMSGSDNLLVADVAGYLFGFPYEEMLIVAGSKDFLAKQASQHYSQRYPDIKVRPVKG